jgi:hypothetical protein
MVFIARYHYSGERPMSFWTSFAKQVILKVLSDGVKGRVPDREEERRCVACGRMVRAETLQEGRCIACRLEQERQRSRKRESESHHTGPSEDNGNELARAYEVLGCRESDSDAEIKKKYRALIKECHVDSLPKDLPDYLVKAANRRFVEVQESYERISEARKMV